MKYDQIELYSALLLSSSSFWDLPTFPSLICFFPFFERPLWIVNASHRWCCDTLLGHGGLDCLLVLGMGNYILMKWEIISKPDISVAFHTEVFTSGWSFHGPLVRMSEPVWWVAVVNLTETRMNWEGAGPLETHSCGDYPNYVNGNRRPMEQPCAVDGTLPCLGSWTVCIERVGLSSTHYSPVTMVVMLPVASAVLTPCHDGLCIELWARIYPLLSNCFRFYLFIFS